MVHVAEKSVRTDGTVGDSGRPEVEQLGEQVVEDLIGDRVRAELVKGGSRHGASDQDGVVARPDLRRTDHLRHPGARPRRELRDRRLVLDLLDPGQADGRSRVPIHDEPVHLAEELGVRSVPAVERHDQGLPRVRDDEVVGGTPGLIPGRLRRNRIDPDRRERHAQFLTGGQAERRAPAEVDGSGHAPTDRHAAEDVGRKAMARHDGRQHGEEHDELDEALHGPRQVRKPCRRDAERQSHVQDGEAQHVAVELDAAWSPATRPEREDEDSADDECPDGRGCEIPHHHPALGQAGHHEEERDRPERSADPKESHQPADAVGRRAQYVRDHVFGVRVGSEDQHRTEHRQGGEDQPNAVGPPAPPLAVADGAKKMARPALRADFVAEGDSVRGGICVATAVSRTANGRRRQSRPVTMLPLRSQRSSGAERRIAWTPAAGGPQPDSPSKSWANRLTRSDESFKSERCTPRRDAQRFLSFRVTERLSTVRTG